MSCAGKVAIHAAMTMLGTVVATHAMALTCDELAGQTFGNARILETQDISGRLPLATMYGGAAELE